MSKVNSQTSKSLDSLEILFCEGEFTEVIRRCDKLLKRGGSVEVLELKADALHMSGKAIEAQEIFLSLLEENPTCSKYYFGAANTSYSLKKFEDARKLLILALKHDPANDLACALLCDCEFRLGFIDEAMQIIERENPENSFSPSSPESRAILLGVKAQIEMSRAYEKQARKTLLSAIQLDRNNPQLYHLLSILNPEANDSTRIFSITMRSQAPLASLELGSSGEYLSECAVAADSFQHALEYLKEIDSWISIGTVSVEDLNMFPCPEGLRQGVIGTETPVPIPTENGEDVLPLLSTMVH